jgi:hypothetical protein
VLGLVLPGRRVKEWRKKGMSYDSWDISKKYYGK